MDQAVTTLCLTDVTKHFLAHSAPPRQVISGLSLEVSGESLATLIGPNGCGKTTLLNLIAGLVRPDKGEIEILPSARTPFKVGYCWQDYRACLLPWMDVVENIVFPLRLSGVPRVERQKLGKRLIVEFLPNVDPHGRAYKLSGGQQQLVCLLRSVMAKPDVLLLDEPFSALDQQRRWSMALYVERIWIDRKVPLIFSSHDVDEAILIADEILLMTRQGDIIRGLRNELPRPRSSDMLTSEEHIRCRKAVIEFLLSQDATLETERHL